MELLLVALITIGVCLAGFLVGSLFGWAVMWSVGQFPLALFVTITWAFGSNWDISTRRGIVVWWLMHLAFASLSMSMLFHSLSHPKPMIPDDYLTFVNGAYNFSFFFGLVLLPSYFILQGLRDHTKTDPK